MNERLLIQKGIGFFSVLNPVFATLFIASFCYVGAHLFFYPFYFEQVEDGVLVVLYKMRQGMPLYGAPTIEYVPPIYMPLYFYVAKLLSYFTGVTLYTTRLISIASTLGLSVLLYCWLRRENAERWLAYTIAGLFLSTFHETDYCFVQGRVDCLFLLLLVAAAYKLRFCESMGGCIAAAILFVLAFFTKQTAMLAIIPLIAATCVSTPKRGVIIGAVFALLTITTIAIFNEVSEGWFSFFVFEIAKYHKILLLGITAFCIDTFRLVYCTVMTCGVFLSKDAELKKNRLFYAALFIGFSGISFVSRLHDGGYLNVLMPEYFVLIFLSGICLIQRKKTVVQSGTGKASKDYFFDLLLLAVQFATLHYDPRYDYATLTPDETKVAHKYVDHIKTLGDNVLMPWADFIPTYADKKPYGLTSFAGDIFRMTNPNPVQKDLLEQVELAISQKKFSAIVLQSYYADFDDGLLIRQGISPATFRAHYCFKESIFDENKYLNHTPLRQQYPNKVFIPCVGK